MSLVLKSDPAEEDLARGEIEIVKIVFGNGTNWSLNQLNGPDTSWLWVQLGPYQRPRLVLGARGVGIGRLGHDSQERHFCCPTLPREIGEMWRTHFCVTRDATINLQSHTGDRAHSSKHQRVDSPILHAADQEHRV